MAAISHCLWFNGQAEEAARYYVSIIPNSSIDFIMPAHVDTPVVKERGVLLVEFTLAGAKYAALNAGPQYSFTPAISIFLTCADQQEVDSIWNALLDGGKPMACGWITDRYGVTWQVVPEALMRMMKDPDEAKARRVMNAMMQMIKFDIPTLERAYAGD